MKLIYIYSRINGVVKKLGVWLSEPALEEVEG
jgi:hypothetical protein